MAAEASSSVACIRWLLRQCIPRPAGMASATRKTFKLVAMHRLQKQQVLLADVVASEEQL